MRSAMRKFRRSTKMFGRGQKGFTLIELLVVIAILGVLAAVAVPAVSSFIGSGDDNAKDIELRDVQTAVVATLAAAGADQLDGASDFTNVTDMHTIHATDPNDPTAVYYCDEYMNGLDDTSVHLGQSYNITLEGKVTVYEAPATT